MMQTQMASTTLTSIDIFLGLGPQKNFAIQDCTALASSSLLTSVEVWMRSAL